MTGDALFIPHQLSLAAAQDTDTEKWYLVLTTADQILVAFSKEEAELFANALTYAATQVPA